MLESYGAATAPSHCTIYYFNYCNYYIIIIIIIIIIITTTIWKGYFSLNPILRVCGFESKKVLLLMWS